MIGLSLRVTHALECPVCERNIDFDQRDEDMTTAALFGAAPYAVCPGCFQIVHSVAIKNDDEYRRRARVRHFERTGTVWPA